MEAISLLGLVIATIGVAYLAHGFLGKMVRGERHSISLTAGATILAALAIVLSDNTAPLLALAFGVLYGLMVERFWREAISYTSSSRGIIKDFILRYVLGTSMFTLAFIFFNWTEHKITGLASEIKSDFISAAGFMAFWTLSSVVAYILKRLMLHMSQPLLRIAGAALVLAGVACIIAPSVLPPVKIA